MHLSKPYSSRRTARAAAGVVLGMLWCSGAALGQGVESEQLPAVKAPQAKAPTQKAPGAAAGGGDSAGLRERVEQLEGQLVDLQVVIGTLERSRARAGQRRLRCAWKRAAAARRALVRLDSAVFQIRALTAQVEQLAAESRANGGRRSHAGAGAGGFAAGSPPRPTRFGSTTVTSDNADPMAGGDLPPPSGRAKQCCTTFPLGN